MNSYVASAVSAVTIVGLIVLIALGKLQAADGLPLIAALAGTHLGAAVSSSPQVTGVTGNTTAPTVTPVRAVTPPTAPVA